MDFNIQCATCSENAKGEQPAAPEKITLTRKEGSDNSIRLMTGVEFPMTFTDKGNGPCTAMDVYMAVCDAYNYVVRDYPEDKLKITRACDAAVSAMQSPWQLLDKDTPANL